MKNRIFTILGALLIGGVGVAKGYYGDRELTEKKFIMQIMFIILFSMKALKLIFMKLMKNLVEFPKIF